jgi:hypothetical protein
MLISLAGLRPEKECAGDAQQKQKLQTLHLVREGSLHQQTCNCL